MNIVSTILIIISLRFKVECYCDGKAFCSGKPNMFSGVLQQNKDRWLVNLFKEHNEVSRILFQHFC